MTDIFTILRERAPKINEFGTKYWTNELGQLHRENDLPAITWADGSGSWLVTGKLHRENDRPAIIWTGPIVEWHLNGKEYWPKVRKEYIMKMNREALIDALQKETIKVTFTKANGDERVMTCTLQKELLPEVSNPADFQPKEENFEIVKVFDIDAKGWRSFRTDAITRVETKTMVSEGFE